MVEVFNGVRPIGAPRPTVTAASLTRQTAGGTLTNPKLFLITTQDHPYAVQLAQFCRDLGKGYFQPLIDLGYGTTHPIFLGQATIPKTAPSLTDAECQALINGAPGLPSGDGETIYILCTSSGTVITGPNGTSCQQFCGYHGGAGGFIYSVIPYPDCGGCLGGQPLTALTMVIAHEVAEASTDTPVGSGWIDTANGEENADECVWQQVPYGGWTVQPYMTNERGCTYGPFTSQPPPPQLFTVSAGGPYVARVGDSLTSIGMLAQISGGTPPFTYDWQILGGHWGTTNPLVNSYQLQHVGVDPVSITVKDSTGAVANSPQTTLTVSTTPPPPPPPTAHITQIVATFDDGTTKQLYP